MTTKQFAMAVLFLASTALGHAQQSKNLSEWLTAGNIKHTFRQTGGAHTWMVWRRYLHEIAPLLFK